MAVAGPVPAEEVGAAYRLALAALPAAEAVGRTGLVHVSEVSTVAALLGRPDVAHALAAAHSSARTELGSALEPLARTVRAWVEHNRDTEATATDLFVHANTVRNRVQRFAAVTGIDPHSSFGAADAWWLCRIWLDEGV